MSEYEPPKTVAELLTRYQNGERYFGEMEWDDATYDLRGVCLEGADFSGGFFFADFQNADLRGVNFTRGNVKTCNFRGADLRGTIFRGVPIDAAEFAGARLDGADFTGASVQSHTMQAGELPQTG